MNKREAHRDIIDTATECDIDQLEVDNEGQIILYTGIYRWTDGSFHTYPEDENKGDT